MPAIEVFQGSKLAATYGANTAELVEQIVKRESQKDQVTKIKVSGKTVYQK